MLPVYTNQAASSQMQSAVNNRPMERRDLSPGQRAILAVQLTRDAEAANGSDLKSRSRAWVTARAAGPAAPGAGAVNVSGLRRGTTG
jgi:hypothetical protein